MLKILLMKDDRILCQIPLMPKDWSGEDFESEMESFFEKFDRYSMLTEALSNQNRLRMLRYLMDEEDSAHSFSDLLRELGMNPKILREHAVKLEEAGYVECISRGKYRLSRKGGILFTTTGLALMRILEALEGEEI